MEQLKISELKVLVVDDNTMFRRQMEDMLRHLGFTHIDQAGDVDEALQKLGGMIYDIIFLDHNMPRKTGYNFLQQCRDDRKYDDMAIIVVSGESNERHIRESMKSGATAYMTKPVLPVALQKNIERILIWKQLRSDG